MLLLLCVFEIRSHCVALTKLDLCAGIKGSCVPPCLAVVIIFVRNYITVLGMFKSLESGHFFEILLEQCVQMILEFRVLK